MKGNPKDRPSIEQVLGHPFLKDTVDFEEFLQKHPLPMIYSTFLSHTQDNENTVSNQEFQDILLELVHQKQ